ncbi:cyclic GMP-AMP synthase isoform X2 [Nasonia vitripennis]|uniref:Cyclic GMP-AMP synthase n=1 Tax=Nasonia vitripennis TaxID=7425 RepID=A0A7M7QGT4_NASVI|nr:cyclic GMP-AMP synthase isoform X2 [Nasonia vitripennis]
MNETYFDSQHSKYRDDTIFDYVSSEFLTLVEKDRKVSDEHLHAVVQEILKLMKQDDLFNLMFREIKYVGSYYKGTKYGTPEEFDLNFIIYLPIDYDDIRIDTNHKNFGFVKIKLDSKATLDPEWQEYSHELDGLLARDNYLNQKKFRSWVESVFKNALSCYETYDGYEFFINDKLYHIKYKKSGPAFTLMIRTEDEIEIDVDIVPCLEFGHMRLKNGFKPMNKELNKTWMVVAKPLPQNNPESNVLWRPCFYQYEKNILEGALKPVIRMVKKLRDTRCWNNLASYYIETLFYHELKKHSCNEVVKERYLRSSKTWLFMHALNQLQKALERQEIPYYWHPKFNLLGKIDEKVLKRYAVDLKKIIAFIDSNLESNYMVLADAVLEKSEARAIRRREKQDCVQYLNFRRRNEFDLNSEHCIFVLAIILLLLIYEILQKRAETDVRDIAV